MGDLGERNTDRVPFGKGVLLREGNSMATDAKEGWEEVWGYCAKAPKSCDKDFLV